MEAGSGWKRDEHWNRMVKMGGGGDEEGRYFLRAALLEWQLVAMETSPKRLRASGFDGMGGARRWGSLLCQPIRAVQTPATHFPHAVYRHLQGYTTATPPLSSRPENTQKKARSIAQTDNVEGRK